MVDQIESNDWRRVRRLAVVSGGVLAAAAVGLAASSERASKPKPRAGAICQALTVVLGQTNHEIYATTRHSVSDGAVYEGTTYAFGDNLPSVTIGASTSTTGALVYDFPPEPGVQHDRVTAVIDYSVPGKQGVYGSADTCTVDMALSPNP